MSTVTKKTNDQTQETANNSGENKNDTSARVAYVANKTERIAGALYALTRPFSPEEPLRQTLRSQALSLISGAHTLQEGASDEDTPASLPAVLRRLRSQLTVAKNGGLISPMNHSVLIEELNRFITEVEEFAAVPGPHLDNSYFNGSAPALTSGNADTSDHTTGRNTSPVSSSSVSAGGGGNKASSAGSVPSQPKKKLSAKEKRRQKILALFDKQDEITVNDVTEVVNGYSTKTVQRDLKALVKAGDLEKHGKRRWTSYTRAEG